MKRALGLVAAALLAATMLVPSPAVTQEADGCGLTTLEGSLVLRPDGLLECGPDEEFVVRAELADATPERLTNRRSLITFAALADLQWADEESPLRGEWADKCPPNSPVSDSAFRPHEAFVGQLANSHVEAVNRIAAAGTPVMKQPLEFVLTLGDLSDNQQWNEIRWFIDLFDGGKLIDTDSGDDALGGDGYDGVQGKDPEGSGVPLPTAEQGGPPVNDALNPLDEKTLLDLANDPFYAPGFRGPNGPLPWYALPGNHDVKVQGTVFDDRAGWRHAVRRYATGNVKVMDLAPDYQARLCDAYASRNPMAVQEVMLDIITNPHRAGTTKIVPSDARRMPLYRSDEEKRPGSAGVDGDEEACLALTGNDLCRSSWLEEQFTTTGIPEGHGYAGDNRCTDAAGNPLPRLCYSFVSGDFLFIGMDTSPPEGLERGSIDQEQFAWIERTIRAHSSSYFDEGGNIVTNPGADDKMVILYSHHPSRSLTNTGLVSEAEDRGAPESDFGDNGAVTEEQFKATLTRFPNVILHSSGHSHENNVWLHENEDLGTGYYEVNSASVADLPSESRVFEIVDNGDGTISIFSTIFEAATAPNARDIHWSDEDPTDERAHGAEAAVNEHWLASFGREVAYHDPQQPPSEVAAARGEPSDRNVELVIPAPFDLSPDPVATSLTYAGDSSGRIGRQATVAAVLRAADGTPLEGMTVTFRRGDAFAAAVTDAAGLASAPLLVTGPKGSKLPVSVTFDGSGIYLPTSIEQGFTATTK